MKIYYFHAKRPKLAAKPLKPAAKPPEVAAKPLDVRIASKPDSKIMYDIALTVQDPCSVQTPQPCQCYRAPCSLTLLSSPARFTRSSAD